VYQMGEDQARSWMVAGTAVEMGRPFVEDRAGWFEPFDCLPRQALRINFSLGLKSRTALCKLLCARCLDFARHERLDGDESVRMILP